MGTTNSAKDVAHETIHAMQHQYNWGIKESEIFGLKRTKNEKPVTLKSQGFSSVGKTFIDNVDDKYALRQYGPVEKQIIGDGVYYLGEDRYGSHFIELLPVAIESLLVSEHYQDQGLHELLMEVIQQYNK